METAGVPYAIGGAIALGYWGAPRGTQDVDLNVFLGPGSEGPGLDALEQAGVNFDRQEAQREIADGGYVRGFVERTPVDAFFDSIPLHESAAGRVVVRPLDGRPARILAAEDLAVLKLLFFRGKDVVDLERLVALAGSSLDRDYVRRWIVDCMGDDDVRVREWDRIVRELG
ncbi:MAG: hypothetical protein H6738_21715 [Alphaproteobacteria bacterium]|nr:hypothetical protein [Alphaproteobacteria bacterium]MCB9699415.1 hypothetical protein [Alphaproteobacteria bacterium]